MPDPNHIPGVEKRSLFSRKLPMEIVGSGPPLIAAGIAALRFWFDTGPAAPTYFWLSVGVAIWLAGASLWKVMHAREQDKEASLKRDHDGLRAALRVLHAAAGHVCGLDPKDLESQLRVTFHRVVPPLERAEYLEQLVPYVGGANNGAGRKFSVRSGITGKAVREKAVYTACLVNDDEAAKKKELKEDWGYTDHDLKNLSMDRLSSMAVPVFDATGHYTLGVVYLDSNQRDLFASNLVQTTIVLACGGITKYVNERYAK